MTLPGATTGARGDHVEVRIIWRRAGDLREA
jgi:hypothetical protein